MIAIGASTGGTEAIASILKTLPAKTPPIVIAQHIPAQFSKAFAARLSGLCAIEVVKEAADGDELRHGLGVDCAPAITTCCCVGMPADMWLR